jgi:hypothetical protein
MKRWRVDATNGRTCFVYASSAEAALAAFSAYVGETMVAYSCPHQDVDFELHDGTTGTIRIAGSFEEGVLTIPVEEEEFIRRSVEYGAVKPAKRRSAL